MKMNRIAACMNLVRKPQGQRGFTLVSAVFLLVVMAVLGAAMMNLSVTQHISSALDVEGARAYQAARAGVEWRVYQSLRQNAPCTGGAASFTPSAPGLSQFTVTVVCDATTFNDAAAPITIHKIQSIACNEPTSGACVSGAGGGTNFVQRVIEVQVEK